MGNPEFLLCDSDALIQVFLTKNGTLLARLRVDFGVVAAVVPEVESEIRNHGKFGNRHEARFLKFVSSGNIAVLGDDALRRLLLARAIPAADVGPRLQDLRERVTRYRTRVDRGEAATHAAGVSLGLPVMSHDWNAVTTLRAAGLPAAAPVLRFFDLVVLANTYGILDDAACEVTRGTLRSLGEYVPIPFSDGSKSFADCLPRFRPRLAPWTGAGDPPGPAVPTDCLYLTRR